MLPRTYRLHQETDWQRLHRRAQVMHASNLILKYLPNRLPYSRFGFIVGNKVAKRATIRNRIRRQLRTAMSGARRDIRPGYDIAFIAKPRLVHSPIAEVRQAALWLLKRARLLRYHHEPS